MTRDFWLQFSIWRNAAGDQKSKSPEKITFWSLLNLIFNLYVLYWLNAANDKLDFLIFHENKAWHFIQAVSCGKYLNEML